jgi:hypothetical protein
VPKIERIAQEIEEHEGFSVAIKPKDRSAAGKTNLPSYKRTFERIARNSFTVADWKRRRFDDAYADFTVDVLLGDGRIAGPRATLAKIRASYD